MTLDKSTQPENLQQRPGARAPSAGLRAVVVLATMVLFASCRQTQRSSERSEMLIPIDSIAPVKDEWIKDLEQRVGGRLPDDYVAFLHRSNGGWIPRDRKPKSLEVPILQGFFPVMTGRISRGDISDSLSVRETLSDGRLPPWFVPIAETGRAAIYCISVGMKDAGKIYVVYEDDDQDKVPFEKREYALVATSFTDFYQQVIGNYAH
jgi:hypothetical protein